MLIILSGLPGTGKTTLARELKAVHLRIDTIEQALRNKGLPVPDEGYRLAYELAKDNLRLGHIVIADSVNPIELTRKAWHDAARQANANYLDVEITCSDIDEHRRRIETRTPDIENHQLPSWQEVTSREYQPWPSARLSLDTAKTGISACISQIC